MARLEIGSWSEETNSFSFLERLWYIALHFQSEKSFESEKLG